MQWVTMMSEAMVILSYKGAFLHADYYVDPPDDDEIWNPTDEYKTSAKGESMDSFRTRCEKEWPGVKISVIEESEF